MIFEALVERNVNFGQFTSKFDPIDQQIEKLASVNRNRHPEEKMVDLLIVLDYILTTDNQDPTENEIANIVSILALDGNKDILPQLCMKLFSYMSEDKPTQSSVPTESSTAMPSTPAFGIAFDEGLGV